MSEKGRSPKRKADPLFYICGGGGRQIQNVVFLAFFYPAGYLA